MKKQNEIRYIVTDVVSIPVIKLNSKTEAYKQATKPGWGTVEWYSAADGYKNPVFRDRKDKTQELACDEDSHADLYTKNGGGGNRDREAVCGNAAGSGRRGRTPAAGERGTGVNSGAAV